MLCAPIFLLLWSLPFFCCRWHTIGSAQTGCPCHWYYDGDTEMDKTLSIPSRNSSLSEGHWLISSVLICRSPQEAMGTAAEKKLKCEPAPYRRARQVKKKKYFSTFPSSFGWANSQIHMTQISWGKEPNLISMYENMSPEETLGSWGLEAICSWGDCVVAWDSKRQEGNSPGEGKQAFGKYMFAGPSEQWDTQRTLNGSCYHTLAPITL